jgi:uncharacterized integral membrane protein
MLQLIVAVGLTVSLVLFSMANTHHVELMWVVGEPIKIRMIFLITIAFVTGSVTTILYQLMERVVRRARERERRRWVAAHAREQPEDG